MHSFYLCSLSAGLVAHHQSLQQELANVHTEAVQKSHLNKQLRHALEHRGAPGMLQEQLWLISQTCPVRLVHQQHLHVHRVADMAEDHRAMLAAVAALKAFMHLHKDNMWYVVEFLNAAIIPEDALACHHKHILWDDCMCVSADSFLTDVVDMSQAPSSLSIALLHTLAASTDVSRVLTSVWGAGPSSRTAGDIPNN